MPEYQNSNRVSVFLSMSDEVRTEDILRYVHYGNCIMLNYCKLLFSLSDIIQHFVYTFYQHIDYVIVHFQEYV